MAKRKRTSSPAFTLFPFLGVLAGVIGTLILIIAGTSQIALANPKQRIEVDALDPAKKTALHVECRADGLVVHPSEGALDKALFIPKHQIEDQAGAWSDLAGRLELDPSRYLLFLVRSEGISTFNRARSALGETRIAVGYEPIFGDGDLSFKKKGEPR